MCECSPSFRVVFNEAQREHIVLALQRRLQDFENRLKRGRRAESCRGAMNNDRLEYIIDELTSAIKNAANESC